MHRESMEIKEEFLKRSKSRSNSPNIPNPTEPSTASTLKSNEGSKSKSKRSRSSKSKSSKSKKRKSQSSLDLFSSIRDRLSNEIHHILFLIVFNLQIVIFSKLGWICSLIAWNLNYSIISMLCDYVGLLFAASLLSWQHAFFAFEYKWIMSEISLEHRLQYFEERIPYFTGFGAPLTLVVLTAPQFVSTGIYALTFPLFIIQAIESHPTNKSSGNGMGNTIKPLRIPVFATTQWLEYALIWYCGNYFCCVRAVLICIQKCGKVLGI